MESKEKVHGGQRRNVDSHAYETAPIAAMFEDCLQSFERLCSIIETEEEEAENTSFPTIGNSHSRFRQWGTDTGAHKRLLDHGLRKSSHLQEATKDLLRDLLIALQTCKCPAFLEERVMWSEIIYENISYNLHSQTLSISDYHPASLPFRFPF